MARTRTRSYFHSGWTRGTWSGIPQNVKRTVTYTTQCTDTVHTPPFGEDGFTILRQIRGRPLRVNYRVQESPTKVVQGYGVPVNMIIPPINSWSYPWDSWKTEALLKVQDSAPVVNLPLAVAELKDLPKLYESIFRKAKTLRNLPDFHLANQFGISPMVSDVLGMLNMADEIARRVRSHQKKVKTKHARGGLSPQAVPTAGAVRSGNTSLSRWPNWQWSASRRLRQRAWYSARLEPTGDLPAALQELNDNPLGVGKLTPDTAWNLIPFSFLIDYFANVGDYLELMGNRMPYKVKSLSLMCTTEIEQTQWSTQTSSPTRIVLGSHGGQYSTLEKWRKVYFNPTPTLSFAPMISGTQALNLLALAAGSARRL